MRTFILIIFLGSLSYFAQAQSEEVDLQKPVTPKEARSRVGDIVTVKGKVAQVSVRKKICYLNFTYKYPDNEFVVVIFKSNFKKFGKLKKFEGKTVKLTGKVTKYRGKPQIKLNNPQNIEIVK